MLNGFSSHYVSLRPMFTDWSMGDRDVGQNSNSFNVHLVKIMFHIFCIAIHLIGLLIEFIDNFQNKETSKPVLIHDVHDLLMFDSEGTFSAAVTVHVLLSNKSPSS